MLIVNLILLLSPLAFVWGRQCVGDGPCSCTFDDGSGTVDLTSIGSSDGARFSDETSITDTFLYNYNPCQPFTLGSCADVAVCQTTPAKDEFYSLGTQNTAEWSFDGTDIQIYYQANTEILRETFVTAVCDPDATDPSIYITGEEIPQQYSIEIRSECACPGVCTASGSGGGLSGGSVLLIIVIVLLFVYIAGGMAYNRYRHEKTGLELLPNRGFWGALPGLVKGGFAYIFGCLSTKKTTYDQV